MYVMEMNGYMQSEVEIGMVMEKKRWRTKVEGHVPQIIWDHFLGTACDGGMM